MLVLSIVIALKHGGLKGPETLYEYGFAFRLVDGAGKGLVYPQKFLRRRKCRKNFWCIFRESVNFSAAGLKLKSFSLHVRTNQGLAVDFSLSIN